MSAEKRVAALLEGKGLRRARVMEESFFNEPDLYAVMRQEEAPQGYFCHARCYRPAEETLWHRERFRMAEVALPSGDVYEGVELAIEIIAAIGEQNASQLFSESRDYQFRDLVVMGESLTTPNREVARVGGGSVSDRTRRLHLDLNAMMLALQQDSEAAHTPGCLLLVHGMPSEGVTQTDGKRCEIYCQTPDDQPIEIANVYLHAGDDLDWPTVDVGVGVERALMRARGAWDIAEVIDED